MGSRPRHRPSHLPHPSAAQGPSAPPRGQAASQPPSSPDPFPTIIADTTARIRAELAMAPNSPLDPDPRTLPPELRAAACFLIIEALHSRLPALAMTPDQIRNANNARILLHRIATGRLHITPPTPAPQQGRGQPPSIAVLRHRPHPYRHSRLQQL